MKACDTMSNQTTLPGSRSRRLLAASLLITVFLCERRSRIKNQLWMWARLLEAWVCGAGTMRTFLNGVCVVICLIFGSRCYGAAQSITVVNQGNCYRCVGDFANGSYYNSVFVGPSWTVNLPVVFSTVPCGGSWSSEW